MKEKKMRKRISSLYLNFSSLISMILFYEFCVENIIYLFIIFQANSFSTVELNMLKLEWELNWKRTFWKLCPANSCLPTRRDKLRWTLETMEGTDKVNLGGIKGRKAGEAFLCYLCNWLGTVCKELNLGT